MGIRKGFGKATQDIGYLNILALEQPIENNDNELFSLADLIKDHNSPEQARHEYAELEKSLINAIQSLNDQAVITLYYYEEPISKEIAKFRIIEGRISKYIKAVLKPKSKLNTK